MEQFIEDVAKKEPVMKQMDHAEKQNISELIEAEQTLLDDVILRLDEKIQNADEEIEKIRKKARDAKESGVPEAYGTIIVARTEQRKQEKKIAPLRGTRKRLYNNHIILEDRAGNQLDLKVGWDNSFDIHGNRITIDYRAESVFPFIGADYLEENNGFRLLSKVKDTIQNDQIINAIQTYSALSGKTVYYDSFLDDLLSHRSDPFFKNIIFSLKKKQKEIITAPYDENILVQGCAGSGKSMIMFHRLPIILFRQSEMMSIKDIAVITPSETYMRMVHNMLQELELEDVYMDTIDQYFGTMITKYQCPSRFTIPSDSVKPERISKETEKRIYTKEFVKSIFEKVKMLYYQLPNLHVQGAEFFGIKMHDSEKDTIAAHINHRIGIINEINKRQQKVINQYRNALFFPIHTLKDLHTMLCYRDRDVKRKLESAASSEERIHLKHILKDERYYGFLKGLAQEIEQFFDRLQIDMEAKGSYSDKDVYRLIPQKSAIIHFYENWVSFFDSYDDPLAGYGESFSGFLRRSSSQIDKLKTMNTPYLPLDYCRSLKKYKRKLAGFLSNAADAVYQSTMNELGYGLKNGQLPYLSCSNYLFLQCLSFLYSSLPYGGRKFIAIDEAQNLTKAELDLIKRVNGKNTIFNLYGDINQHIEGSKGVEKWVQLTGTTGYQRYKDYKDFSLEQNYRNAVPITEYCNRHLGLSMQAICVDGPDVYCTNKQEKLNTDIIEKLKQKLEGELCAIIIRDKKNVKGIARLLNKHNIPFKNLLFNSSQLDPNKWNLLLVDDVRGLEFKRVVVFDNDMTHNERYVAYTRALDELLIYSGLFG